MASLTPRQWVSVSGLLLLVIIAAVIIFAALKADPEAQPGGPQTQLME
ncbi:hypothetical protein [Nesterenkonia pannonica]|nr:hypothetical protein [Nesterenkonia pannonica]